MFAADYLLNLEIRLFQLSKREDTKFAYDLLFFLTNLQVLQQIIFALF